VSPDYINEGQRLFLPSGYTIDLVFTASEQVSVRKEANFKPDQGISIRGFSLNLFAIQQINTTLDD